MAWPPLPELFSDMENHGMDRALFQPVIHGRFGVKRLGRLGFATVQTNMNLHELASIQHHLYSLSEYLPGRRGVYQ